MQQTEFSQELRQASYTADNPPADYLIKVLRSTEDLLYQGKQDIQPIKIYQVSRIYKLAKAFIEVVRIIWPHIRTIISLIKNISHQKTIHP